LKGLTKETTGGEESSIGSKSEVEEAYLWPRELSNLERKRE